MSRLLLVLASALLAALLTAAPAAAKGPSEASVEGPGLAAPVDLDGDEGSGPLGEVTEAAGFFPAVFLRTPDPMLRERPAGELGPRYVATYTVPGPNNELDGLRQELYPYAEPAPVSYMAPGQTVFGTEKTVGGWFVGTDQLRETLVAAGLPETAPAATADTTTTSFPWTVVGGLAGLAVALGLTALVVQLLRRQPRSAT